MSATIIVSIRWWPVETVPSHGRSTSVTSAAGWWIGLAVRRTFSHHGSVAMMRHPKVLRRMTPHGSVSIRRSTVSSSAHRRRRIGMVMGGMLIGRSKSSWYLRRRRSKGIRHRSVTIHHSFLSSQRKGHAKTAVSSFAGSGTRSGLSIKRFTRRSFSTSIIFRKGCVTTVFAPRFIGSTRCRRGRPCCHLFHISLRRRCKGCVSRRISLLRLARRVVPHFG